MSEYTLQKNPVRIPVPDNKLIEEHFGRVSTQSNGFSVARMVAPPGWSEPAQKPNFDEITIMIAGKMDIETEDGDFTLEAGQTFLAPKGKMVCYKNPYPEKNEYWAICFPAFSPELANRQ